MSGGFVKIYGSILDSSVWAEPAPTRCVWVAMLAMADPKGHVEASVTGLARRANVTIAECIIALETFLNADFDSKSPDHDGRRIEKVDSGWLVLNYVKHREMRSPKQVAEADRKRDYRNAKGQVAGQAGRVPDVPAVPPRSRSRSRGRKKTPLVQPAVEPTTTTDAFDDFWLVYPRRAGSNPKADARRKWEARLKEGALPQDMIQGARRYYLFVVATDKLDTEFVMQAVRFLGPSRHYQEPWKIPGKAAAVVERIDRRNANASEERRIMEERAATRLREQETSETEMLNEFERTHGERFETLRARAESSVDHRHTGDQRADMVRGALIALVRRATGAIHAS